MFLRKKHEKYTHEDIFSISDKSPPLKLFTKWHTPRVCVETVACDPLRALCFKGLQLPNNKILETNDGNVFLKRHIKKGIFFFYIMYFLLYNPNLKSVFCGRTYKYFYFEIKYPE